MYIHTTAVHGRSPRVGLPVRVGGSVRQERSISVENASSSPIPAPRKPYFGLDSCPDSNGAGYVADDGSVISTVSDQLRSGIIPDELWSDPRPLNTVLSQDDMYQLVRLLMAIECETAGSASHNTPTSRQARSAQH